MMACRGVAKNWIYCYCANLIMKTCYRISTFIIYLLQNMFFLHMRYRQELRSRIAAQYLESRIRSKIDKTHITALGEKAVSPNDWLTYPRDHIIPREKKRYHQMIG